MNIEEEIKNFKSGERITYADTFIYKVGFESEKNKEVERIMKENCNDFKKELIVKQDDSGYILKMTGIKK